MTAPRYHVEADGGGCIRATILAEFVLYDPSDPSHPSGDALGIAQGIQEAIALHESGCKIVIDMSAMQVGFTELMAAMANSIDDRHSIFTHPYVQRVVLVTEADVMLIAVEEYEKRTGLDGQIVVARSLEEAQRLLGC